MSASLRVRLALFLLGILVWIGLAVGIYLADAKLSLTAFFVGYCMFIVMSLSILHYRPLPRVVFRFRILLSSIVVFSLSASFFVLALIASEGVVFYTAVALLILGSGELLVLVKRSSGYLENRLTFDSPVPRTTMTSMEVYADYSITRARLWGLLIGVGLALGIASATFAFWGNPVFAWGLLLGPSFGLLGGSIIGFWLDLRSHRRRKLEVARATSSPSP